MYIIVPEWLAVAAPNINLRDDRTEAAAGEPHVDLVECREPKGQTLLATGELSKANLIHAWMSIGNSQQFTEDMRVISLP